MEKQALRSDQEKGLLDGPIFSIDIRVLANRPNKAEGRESSENGKTDGEQKGGKWEQSNDKSSDGEENEKEGE
jgi:hypothetical protein